VAAAVEAGLGLAGCRATGAAVESEDCCAAVTDNGLGRDSGWVPTNAESRGGVAGAGLHRA
jgi:hypothetical protein